MFYVGMDVHRNRSNACILDDDGRPVKTLAVKGHVDGLIQALRAFGETRGQPLAVAYEASLGYGAIHERLSRFCQRIVVAHPGRLRLISQSKRKHDRIDAEKLAMLLRLQMLPAVHVPAVDVRQWRQVIEFRRRAVDQRTRIKNGLQAILRSEVITKPREAAGCGRRKAWRGWVSSSCPASRRCVATCC